MVNVLEPNCDTSNVSVRANGWKNLLFEHNGASHLCEPLYDTESEAKENADCALGRLAESRDGSEITWVVTLYDGRGTQVLVADISHILQIPWD